MKKYFGIKILSFIFLTLICFLMVNDRVEAGYKLTCNYKIPEAFSSAFSHQECENSTEKCKKFWKDYVIQLKVNDNNKWEFGFYNTQTKKFDNSESGENYIFYSHDLWIDSEVTTSAFNQYWDNPYYDHCPQVLNSSFDTICSYSNGYIGEGNCFGIFPYDITNNSKSSEIRRLADYCAKNKEHCVEIEFIDSEESGNKQIDDGSNSKSNATDGTTKCTTDYLFSCDYALVKSDDTKTKFTMHVNNSNICFDNYDSEIFGTDDGKRLPYAVFSAKDLNGNCPNVLYGNTNSGTMFLRTYSYSDGTYDWKFGRKISIDDMEESTKSPEEAIRDGKTMEYIKKVYNLIRFIAPVLIITFSIIDFTGVVISGDTDKMEKAKKKFVVRIIIGIAFILIPVILELLLKFAGVLKPGESLANIVYNVIK